MPTETAFLRTGETPTIRDVAAMAGVSVSSVSKYLTGRPYVSQATGLRIRDAVDRLEFRPNGLARGLATRRTDVLGVVVPSLGNPFYTELVRAIDAGCSDAGFHIFLASTDRDPDRERDLIQVMLQKEVDGLVLAHVAMSDAELVRVVADRKQVVFASRHLPELDADFVVIDGVAGSALAVEHLAGLGHERIALICGPTSVVQFAQRREGYLAALGRLGLPTPAHLLIEGTSRVETGHRGMDLLLELPPGDRPTAIHTGNDLIALGVLQRAHERGISVPRELSVVGFDDIAFAQLAQVPLTTVDSRIDDMGRRAVGMLIDRLRGGAADAPARQVVLDPRLVVRESTAAPAIEGDVA